MDGMRTDAWGQLLVGLADEGRLQRGRAGAKVGTVKEKQEQG
jgi:hypothetical protein